MYTLSFMAFFLALIVNPLYASVYTSVDADRQEIKKMAGCYRVQFQNAETFRLDSQAPFYPPHSSQALEWIVVDQETQNQIELQHLLITPGGIVKHWRQVWDYEAAEHLRYTHHLHWKKVELDSQLILGEWTQRVYQVDDSPRYECSAAWIHTRQGSFWQCRADSPLPRREFSARSDYNILERGNKHFSTSEGWVHEQDNTKILRQNGIDKALMMEKGYQTYTLVSEELCQSAQQWWQTHRPFWKEVQQVWSEITSERSELKLSTGAIWQKLFELHDLWTQQDFNASVIRQDARRVIEAHLN